VNKNVHTGAEQKQTQIEPAVQ